MSSSPAQKHYLQLLCTHKLPSSIVVTWQTDQRLELDYCQLTFWACSVDQFWVTGGWCCWAMSLLQAYLEYLTVSGSNWPTAAAMLPRLLRDAAPLWERWLYKFAQVD
jgi:hypothetical protein